MKTQKVDESRMRPEDVVELRRIADEYGVTMDEAMALIIESINAQSAKMSKTLRESHDQRIYRGPSGEVLSCSIQHQREYDDYDGQQPGWYGWCGLIDKQSDYMIGPYESREAVFAAYEKRNKKHVRLAGVKLFRGFIGPDNRMHGKAPEFIPRASN